MEPSLFSLRKATALGVAFCVFTTQVALGALAESSVWKERRAPKQLAALPSAFNEIPLRPNLPSTASSLSNRPRQLEKIPAPLRDLASAIDFAHGSIRDIYSATNSAARPVVLIQDIHMNTEAQANTAAIIQRLIDSKQAGMVGVEGAFSDFDFTRFRAFPDKKIVKEVTEAFLEKNLLSAPTYVGITSLEAPPLFTGIDDETHYRANVDAYLATRDIKKKALTQIETAKRTLAEAKLKTFSPQLKAFDDLNTAFHQGSIGFGIYVKRLSGLAHSDTDLAIDQFLQAYDMESALDFGRIESERRVIIGRLTETLTDAELKNLLEASVAYRSGAVGFGDYYQSLRELCQRKGIDLRATPAFDGYIRYVLLSDGINAEKLFAAVERLEDSLRDSLATTPAEKELAAQSERLNLTSKLVEFSLTPKEWSSYKLLALSSKLNTFNLEPFERFYEEADVRSHKMVQNLLSLKANSLKLTANSAVVVAGGFHTPQLTALLRERKIPYIVVAPKVMNITDESGSGYLSVFAQEKTPLDRLFAGEKLFVYPEILNLPTPGKATRSGRRALLGTIACVCLAIGMALSPLTGTQRAAAKDLPPKVTAAEVTDEGERVTVYTAPADAKINEFNPAEVDIEVRGQRVFTPTPSFRGSIKSLLSRISAFSLSNISSKDGKDPDDEKNKAAEKAYGKAKQETDYLKKLESLRSLVKDYPSSPSCNDALNDLWKLEKALDPGKAAETYKRYLKQTGYEPGNYRIHHWQEVYGLLLIAGKIKEAEYFMEFQATKNKTFNAPKKEDILRYGADLALMKGDVDTAIKALEDGGYGLSGPAMADELKQIKKAREKANKPFPKLGDSIGDSKAFRENPATPIKLFISPDILKLDLPKEVKDSDFFRATKNKDKNYFEAYVRDLNQAFLYVSGGKFGLKFDGVEFDPILTVSGKNDSKLDILTSPIIDEREGKGLSLFFTASRRQNTQSLGRGVVFMGPEFASGNKVSRLTCMHEIFHQLGMIHPLAPDLVSSGHRFEPVDLNDFGTSGKWISSDREWIKDPVVGVSTPLRIRLGWPERPTVRIDWTKNQLSSDFPRLKEKPQKIPDVSPIAESLPQSLIAKPRKDVPVAEAKGFQVISDANTTIQTILIHVPDANDPILAGLLSSMRKDVSFVAVVPTRKIAEDLWLYLSKKGIKDLTQRLRIKIVDGPITPWARDPVVPLANLETKQFTLIDGHEKHTVSQSDGRLKIVTQTEIESLGSKVLGSDVGIEALVKTDLDKKLPFKWKIDGGDITADDTFAFVSGRSIKIHSTSPDDVASRAKVISQLSSILGRKIVVLYNDDAHNDRTIIPVSKTPFGDHTVLLADPDLLFNFVASLTPQQKAEAAAAIEKDPDLDSEDKELLKTSFERLADREFVADHRDYKFIRESLKGIEKNLTENGLKVVRIPSFNMAEPGVPAINSLPIGFYFTNIIQDTYWEGGRLKRVAYIPSYSHPALNTHMIAIFKSLGFDEVFPILNVRNGAGAAGLRCRVQILGLPVPGKDPAKGPGGTWFDWGPYVSYISWWFEGAVSLALGYGAAVGLRLLLDGILPAATVMTLSIIVGAIVTAAAFREGHRMVNRHLLRAPPVLILMVAYALIGIPFFGSNFPTLLSFQLTTPQLFALGVLAYVTLFHFVLSYGYRLRADRYAPSDGLVRWALGFLPFLVGLCLSPGIGIAAHLNWLGYAYTVGFFGGLTIILLGLFMPWAPSLVGLVYDQSLLRKLFNTYERYLADNTPKTEKRMDWLAIRVAHVLEVSPKNSELADAVLPLLKRVWADLSHETQDHILDQLSRVYEYSPTKYARIRSPLLLLGHRDVPADPKSSDARQLLRKTWNWISLHRYLSSTLVILSLYFGLFLGVALHWQSSKQKAHQRITNELLNKNYWNAADSLLADKIMGTSPDKRLRVAASTQGDLRSKLFVALEEAKRGASINSYEREKLHWVLTNHRDYYSEADQRIMANKFASSLIELGKGDAQKKLIGEDELQARFLLEQCATLLDAQKADQLRTFLVNPRGKLGASAPGAWIIWFPLFLLLKRFMPDRRALSIVVNIAAVVESSVLLVLAFPDAFGIPADSLFHMSTLTLVWVWSLANFFIHLLGGVMIGEKNAVVVSFWSPHGSRWRIWRAALSATLASSSSLLGIVALGLQAPHWVVVPFIYAPHIVSNNLNAELYVNPSRPWTPTWVRRKIANVIAPERTARLARNLDRLSRAEEAVELDSKTGLYNETAWKKALARLEMSRARAPGSENGLFAVDVRNTDVIAAEISNFGPINKIIGQDVGDLFLALAGRALNQAMGGHSRRMFRLPPGNNFAVLSKKEEALDFLMRARSFFGQYTLAKVLVPESNLEGHPSDQILLDDITASALRLGGAVSSAIQEPNGNGQGRYIGVAIPSRRIAEFEHEVGLLASFYSRKGTAVTLPMETKTESPISLAGAIANHHIEAMLMMQKESRRQKMEGLRMEDRLPDLLQSIELPALREQFNAPQRAEGRHGGLLLWSWLVQRFSDVRNAIANFIDYEWSLDERRIARSIHKKERERDTDMELTRLPNWNAFEGAKKRVMRNPQSGLLFGQLDANSFGAVNRYAGWEAGNELIQLIAAALIKAGRKSGISQRQLFRVGGDEFALIAPKENAQATMDDARKFLGNYFIITIGLPQTAEGGLKKLEEAIDTLDQKARELRGIPGVIMDQQGLVMEKGNGRQSKLQKMAADEKITKEHEMRAEGLIEKPGTLGFAIPAKRAEVFIRALLLLRANLGAQIKDVTVKGVVSISGTLGSTYDDAGKFLRAKKDEHKAEKIDLPDIAAIQKKMDAGIPPDLVNESSEPGETVAPTASDQDSHDDLAAANMSLPFWTLATAALIFIFSSFLLTFSSKRWERALRWAAKFKMPLDISLVPIAENLVFAIAGVGVMKFQALSAVNPLAAAIWLTLSVLLNLFIVIFIFPQLHGPQTEEELRTRQVLAITMLSLAIPSYLFFLSIGINPTKGWRFAAVYYLLPPFPLLLHLPNNIAYYVRKQFPRFPGWIFGRVIMSVPSARQARRSAAEKVILDLTEPEILGVRDILTGGDRDLFVGSLERRVRQSNVTQRGTEIYTQFVLDGMAKAPQAQAQDTLDKLAGRSRPVGIIFSVENQEAALNWNLKVPPHVHVAFRDKAGLTLSKIQEIATTEFSNEIDTKRAMFRFLMPAGMDLGRFIDVEQLDPERYAFYVLVFTALNQPFLIEMRPEPGTLEKQLKTIPELLRRYA